MSLQVDNSFFEQITVFQSDLRSILARNGISCNDLIDVYQKLIGTPKESELASLFKIYRKTVLDLTFNCENKLADEEFRSNDAVENVNNIIRFLTGLEVLSRCFGQWEADELDKEMKKCLLWRKGALLYMYCATIYGDPQRHSILEQPYFPKFLTDGVMYLTRMLDVYSPLIVPEESGKDNHKDVAVLLAKGARESNDMLAMMYAGEMCYWYTTLPTEPSASADQFPARRLAVQFLQRYVQIAQEPCFAQSWSCDRAQSLLDSLQSTK